MAKIIETFDPDFIAGYDIGCSFETTIGNSSLGDAFREKRGRMCVSAFHAYTHSHICQLEFHPNNVDGMGIEDVETLERVFSGSNALASVTRFASAYRRRLLIETYFKQWDEDKYLNTGVFLLNNYMQALEIIEQNTSAVEQAMREFGVTADTLEEWALEERQFFATLGNDDEFDMRRVAYVELLQQLRDVEPALSRASGNFIAYDPSGSSKSYKEQLSETRRLETNRRHAIEMHSRITFEICQLEAALDIARRWTPLDPEYVEAATYIRERKYKRALDKLQKLVIQRLFELHKLNIAQTGTSWGSNLPCLVNRLHSVQDADTSVEVPPGSLQGYPQGRHRVQCRGRLTQPATSPTRLGTSLTLWVPRGIHAAARHSKRHPRQAVDEAGHARGPQDAPTNHASPRRARTPERRGTALAHSHS